MHALTATPVRTTPDEVWELLECCDSVDRRRPDEPITVLRCIAANVDLHANGVRVSYDPGVEVEIIDLPVHEDLYDETVELYEEQREMGAPFTPLPYEHLYLASKLEAVRDLITAGTVVYLHSIGGDNGGKTILDDVMEFVTVKLGLSAGTYVGANKNQTEDQRRNNLRAFVNGKLDVLIASEAISEGTDSLQKRCHTLVQLISPWHSAAQVQLIARFARAGAKTSKLMVYRPYITFPNPANGGAEWSWCRLMRLDVIDRRAAMGDLVLDGTPTGSMTPGSYERAREGAFVLLNNMDDFHLAGERPQEAVLTDDRPDEVLTEAETRTREQERANARRRFKTLEDMVRQRPAAVLHEMLAKQPQLWEEYWVFVQASRTRQLVDPNDLALQKLLIGLRPGDVVADFGGRRGRPVGPPGDGVPWTRPRRSPSITTRTLPRASCGRTSARPPRWPTPAWTSSRSSRRSAGADARDLFEGAFPEARRVLNDHGRLIIVERERILTNSALDGFEDALTGAGFTVIDRTSVPYDNVARDGVLPAYAIITAVAS